MEARRFGLPVVLWVFGIATTVSLISLWGRAVVVDTGLIRSAAATAATADVVVDRVESWVADELPEAEGTGLLEEAFAQPIVERAIVGLVEDVVVAASQPAGGMAVVDVAGHLAPAAEVISSLADEQGLSLEEASVADAVARLRPIVIRSEGSVPVVGAGSPAARGLYLATLGALAVMVVAGAGAVALADDRRLMVRSLFNRIAVSALSFAIITSLASWVLDPGRGRSPARSAAAQLVGAKWWVPLVVAAGAGIAGAVLWRRRQAPVRPEAASPPPTAAPTPPSAGRP
ncbi:MAG: hypothetical protein R6X29_08810 [Acidimicrobiia bacterium]|jgi:hypothetical protein